MDVAGKKTGSATFCNLVVRGHVSSTRVEYWSGDIWGIYDTTANLEAAKGVVCDTDTNAASPLPSALTGSENCSVASDGNSAATATKTGWASLGTKSGKVNLANG